FCDREDVVERVHALGVHHRVEELGAPTADPLERRVLADELRVLRPELAEPGLEPVILRVGDECGVRDVIRLVELDEPPLELLDLAPRAIEVLAGGRLDGGHATSLSTTTDTRYRRAVALT